MFSFIFSYVFSSHSYSKPCQTSKMELFVKIVNGFLLKTILTKLSILDVFLGSVLNTPLK